MTDVELVAKKLAFIETCVRELQTMAQPQLLATDIREQRFVEHTLRLAVQATLDIAAHIVSDNRMGEPATNHELFDLLCRGGWIADPQRGVLCKMIEFKKPHSLREVRRRCCGRALGGRKPSHRPARLRCSGPRQAGLSRQVTENVVGTKLELRVRLPYNRANETHRTSFDLSSVRLH